MISKKISKKLTLAFVALVGATGVIIGTVSGASDSRSSKGEVTFSKDVAPIFFKDCAQCHKPNDIAPMSLLSYRDVRPWARSIKEKVLSREMPPWGADPRFGAFANEHRLTQQQVDTIVAWVDQGAKEGDPKDLPPAPKHLTGWAIGEPDVVLSMAEDYVVEPNAPDNYINFFIPTNFKEDKWIRAAEIKPGNKRVVHHVIAFVQTPEAIRRMREGNAEGRGRRRGDSSPLFYRDGTLSRVRMDAPVVDDGCGEASDGQRRRMGEGAEAFGSLLSGYAPGKDIDIWPAGTAKLVPAGSVIMFQIHYSNVWRGEGGEPEKDRTVIGLKFADEPERAILTLGVSNAMFKIPPGAENHVVTACHIFDADVEIISYMPHMHLRGKSMKYEAVYPDGRRETLLWVPKFNFNWQTMYNLARPMTMPKGARLIVTGAFDNSPKNKYNPDPTLPVRWGDPTYDEMMIGWMDFTIPNPKRAGAAQASTDR